MITISNLTFGYQKKQPVLRNLNLQLSAGHIYGLLGRNGAGKSSLLHTICGLLFPQAGTCQVIGQIPAERKPAFLQKVFLLPEEFYVPNVSVKNYLATYAPFYPEFNETLFYQFLKEFEIQPQNTLHGMSYGQKKKVMISFALATQAKVLLLDEPTNGLDIPSKKQFRKIIAGLVQDDQIIIISTHQVRDLDSLIDHVLLLDDQQIIINEPVDNLTAKLVFKQAMDLSEVPQILYHEGGLKGYAVVALNKHSENSRLDMELFFNAVLSQKKQILPLFNS